MSFGIDLSIEARHKLALTPVPVRRQALKQLGVLAEDPTALSVRSYFPYRQMCQLYQFDYGVELQRWELCVLSQYGADEQTIHVLGIDVSHREPWEGLPPDPSLDQGLPDPDI